MFLSNFDKMMCLSQTLPSVNSSDAVSKPFRQLSISNFVLIMALMLTMGAESFLLLTGINYGICNMLMFNTFQINYRDTQNMPRIFCQESQTKLNAYNLEDV